MADAMNNDESNKNSNNVDDRQDNNVKNVCTAEERSEYFNKLEKWLQEAYAWQSVAAMFPYHILSGQIFNQPGAHPFITPLTVNVNSTPETNSTNTPAGTPEWQRLGPLRQRPTQEPRTPLQPPRAEGYEYRIPPIWKRFVAEFIDSIILLMFKFMITFFTLDLFASLSLEPYPLDLLQSNLHIDYKMAVEVASRVLIWEIMHRVIVCAYEAFWLRYGMNGTIGGASPGKFAMGLIVVQCRSITPVEGAENNDLVFVSPGTDLGFPLALGRSVVKNLIMTFLFPICFALFFFRFNRTGYDLACNSIVVEDPLRDGNVRFRRQ
ncbi:protein FAM8A1 [Venturia canescens]|uniref:protein FAM8A1 n=1 Tax=Venturia canescens TaxID=32260 RepID=UPI001C9CDEE6|nr:protein FAM8A1 [Venturia canescens]XP_043284700.1 protein FAM8A1 [Venturia canescens]XP_043284701.1 protein FAM8A1 [Venturia canescens]XP_043284702.1 protein FAM8A1 [Venturia canescens]